MALNSLYEHLYSPLLAENLLTHWNQKSIEKLNTNMRTGHLKRRAQTESGRFCNVVYFRRLFPLIIMKTVDKRFTLEGGNGQDPAQ